MKILLVLAFLAMAAADQEAPEPVYLQEHEMPQQIYPVDASPMIVPPQVIEAIRATNPEALGYEMPADGVSFVNSPDDSVIYVNDPEYGYERPVKIYVDPNLR